ncbi:hypothetical protein BDY21DRAFT_283650 [Lineolata rhizophorae]|uniref:Mitochondrial export protein Som1 n=1 Tax=Lineolata rhizophorae TaxID=578093 RepID=A0A6A6P3F8_9PEZI|nr:hypothetical protein BDY21DRAFT_283650 [Lineolata rhizophorae]
MPPPLSPFPPSSLPQRVQYRPDGKRRKGPPVELDRCELLQLSQYACNLAPAGETGPHGEKKVLCEELVRLFRRCANGLTVETTSWEGW